MKIDFHVHTDRSVDGVHRPREMVKYARNVGLDAIAITDHNQLFPWNEARRLSKEFGIVVIPGIEGGNFALGKHWIAIGIRDRPVIKKICDLPKIIQDRSGLAIAPHPYTRLGYDNYADLGFKVVEAFNGTEPEASRKVCHTRGISEVTGSDSHAAPMLGFCWSVVDACETIEDILESVRKGFCISQGTRVPFSRCLHLYGVYFTNRILCRPASMLYSLYEMAQSPCKTEEGEIL